MFLAWRSCVSRADQHSSPSWQAFAQPPELYRIGDETGLAPVKIRPWTPTGGLSRTDEAARMQKEVLEKRRRILGEEHPDH